MVSFASLAATTLALATSVLANSAACPYNYPVQLNTTTSSNGLIFQVISNNPLINNRVVQLISNPRISGGSFAGVDNTSSVLLSNFRNGAWESQARNIYNQLYDLGPTAYLAPAETVNGTSRFPLAFANSSISPGHVDNQWQLDPPTSDGVYNVYHQEPVGTANGFIICSSRVKKTGAPFYQLFYQTYSSTPHQFPGCESIGLRTHVGATILNGACNIGGYTAS